MPEGDTIHRAARRIDAALVGRTMDIASAPSTRSPLHNRAEELAGRTLERAEARGKHLLLHFSGEQVVHSHLGMSGRWRIRADGRLPYGKPWLMLASGRGVAAVTGGKILRLVSSSRARNDPALLQLGPDPLAPGFDDQAAARRLLGWEPTETVGAALNDQSLIAGIGNVIRIEALWIAKVSPWRKIGDLTPEEALAIVEGARWVMETAIRKGSRPRRIYGRQSQRRGCPRCRGPVDIHGQGDDNRTTFWCPNCQR